jgi:hypothetical protein
LLPTKTISINIGVICLGLGMITPSYADMVFNQNLISNPGAESGAGSPYNNLVVPVPNWISTGGFTVVQYRTPPCNLPCLPGLPETNDPGPPNRGVNMFAGGSNDFENTHGNQTVDVSNSASIIDFFHVNFVLSGWFGGYLYQRDNAELDATFETGAGSVLGTVSIGSVMPSDRIDSNGNYYTGLLFRSTTGVIPAGTRKIDLQLTMHGVDGSENDGYADNLSFTACDPRTAIPEPASVGTMLLGLTALGVLLRRRKPVA